MCNKRYTPTGQNQKRCAACRYPYWEERGSEGWLRRKESAEKAWKNKAAREGRKHGVGSGNAFGKGPGHPVYKDGIGIFRRFKKDKCERCSSTKFLCVHHKDQNRHNNVLSNLETLCKRCHQLEHDCYAALPKGEALSDMLRKRMATEKKYRKRNRDGTWAKGKIQMRTR